MLVVENCPDNASDIRDAGLIPGKIRGSEDPPEKEMATHSSVLAWEMPWTEDPGRLHKVGHDWSDSACTDW